MKGILYRLRLLVCDLTYNKLVFWSSFFMIFVISCLFLLSNVLVSGTSTSINNVTNKLGADIVIVSDKFDSDMQDTLFTGNPSTFEFDTELTDKIISEVDGIEISSKQLFMSSLADSCCDEQLQFIVFDENTDFLITPWLDKYKVSLGKRDIVVGHNIDYEVGEKATFFECVFNVVGKLDETNMGYDNCVFVNEDGGLSITRFLHLEELTNQASVIFIKVTDNEQIEEIQEKINSMLVNTDLVAYRSNELYADISSSIAGLSSVIYAFLLIVCLISAVALFAIISLNIGGRRDDFSLLNDIGIALKKQLRIILYEYFIETFVAAVLGNILGLIILFTFKSNIEYGISIPIVIDKTVFLFIIVDVICSILVVMLASYYALKNQIKILGGEQC